MSKEERLEKIGECIHDDVKGITEAFTPLYLKWVGEKGNEYLENNDEDVALQATMNLLTNGLLNITANVVSNFLREARASKYFSDQTVDTLEVTFNKGIQDLKERCKDGFEEENK